MAHVTLPPFVESISGRVGNLSFRRTPSGKTSVTLYKPHQRTSPVTPKEQTARSRFAQIAKTVTEMQKQGSTLSRKELWKIASKAYE